MTLKIECHIHSDGTSTKHWRNEEEKLHREDGPAIVWEDGTHSYYLNGKQYTKKEYWKEIKKIKKRRERKSKK